MKRQVWLRQNSWRYVYFRYKDSPYYLASIIIIFVVIILFLLFQVIIPQTENWFSIRNEVVATTNKINIIKNNINLINNIDRTVLTEQLQISTEALPAQQDFTAILAAISNAALIAQVTLNDFSFQITPSVNTNNQQSNGLIPVQLTFGIIGQFDNTKNFLKELNQTLPLSQVTQVSSQEQSTAITLEFYQKPFSRSTLSPETPILPLTDVQTQLLRKLASWQVHTLQPMLSQPMGGSSSAVPLF